MGAGSSGTLALCRIARRVARGLAAVGLEEK